MQLINQVFDLSKNFLASYLLLQLKDHNLFKNEKLWFFYDLIVTIFPRNGVSITILNFNLIIIE